MSYRFHIAALTKDQITQAYPVVQAALPGITLEQWRAFAAAPSTGRGLPNACGIITLQDRRGYIRGLFSYSVECDLTHGRVLFADNVVVLGLGNRNAGMSMLLQAMESVARRHGCAAIKTHLREGVNGVADRRAIVGRFRDEGHSIEGLTLCKPVEG
jgi:hypothetical protein